MENAILSILVFRIAAISATAQSYAGVRIGGRGFRRIMAISAIKIGLQTNLGLPSSTVNAYDDAKRLQTMFM